MKKNTTINRSMKLKFLFVLVLSNSSMALILTGYNQETPPQKISEFIRKDYITLKINATLKTKFDPSVPVTITDKEHRFIIKEAFLLEKIEFHNEGLMERINTQYIIEIKRKDFSKLAKMNKKLIYPYPLEFKDSKRRSYEILF